MSVLLRFLGVLALAACTSVNAIDVALVNANVYAAPDAVAMPGATIVVRDGRIASVTPGGAAPADAQLIDLNGATVVAGFWNSHVHLLAESLRNAATAS